MGVWLLGCGGVASLTLFGSGESEAESQSRGGAAAAARGGEAAAGGRTSSFFTALRPEHCTPQPQPGRRRGHGAPLDASSPHTRSPDASSPDVTTSGSSSSGGGGGSGSGSSGGSSGGGGVAAARVMAPSVLPPPPSVAAPHASFASPMAPATHFVQATPLAHQRRGQPGQPGRMDRTGHAELLASPVSARLHPYPYHGGYSGAPSLSRAALRLHPCFYSLVALHAATNLEWLRFLPWSRGSGTQPHNSGALPHKGTKPHGGGAKPHDGGAKPHGGAKLHAHAHAHVHAVTGDGLPRLWMSRARAWLLLLSQSVPQLLLQSLLLSRLGATSTDLGPLQSLLAFSLCCSVAALVPRAARCCRAYAAAPRVALKRATPSPLARHHRAAHAPEPILLRTQSWVADTLPRGKPYHDTPYHNTPYHNTPYHNTPYHNTPYHKSLRADFGVDSAASPTPRGYPPGMVRTPQLCALEEHVRAGLAAQACTPHTSLHPHATERATPCTQPATPCTQQPATPRAQPATPCTQPATPCPQAAWLTRQQLVSRGLASAEGREFQGGEGGSSASASDDVPNNNSNNSSNSEAIAAQRQWLRSQELLAVTPFSVGEELRAPTPLVPSPMATLGDTPPASACLPPSFLSPRRLSASEILPPPCLPDEGEEGAPVGLDLLALGGADPLPVAPSRPPPPPQHRRKQAGPPLHLRTAPPAGAATACAAAATCAVGAGTRGGAPGGGTEGGWKGAGNQSGAAVDGALAPLRASSQTPDPPTRQRGLANSESWSPPSTM